MIVSEKNVSDALTYLAQGGAADAEAAHLAAERALERRSAEVYLASKGTVTEREMLVLIDADYQKLLEKEHAAKVDLTKAKARVSGADKIIEIWRTEQSNIRAAEKIR